MKTLSTHVGSELSSAGRLEGLVVVSLSRIEQSADMQGKENNIRSQFLSLFPLLLISFLLLDWYRHIW